MSAHRLHFRLLGSGNAAVINGWPHRSGITVVEMTDQQRAKINCLHIPLEWLKPDALPDEGFSDKSFSAPPPYLAVTAHISLRPSGRISEVLLLTGEAFRTFPIPARGHLLFQCFMRAEAIINFHPSTGAMLLALTGARRGASSFGFENAVHLLMRSIFLRMPRPDELNADAQSDPPGAQARQTSRSGRGERTTVIGPNNARQSIMLKKLQEYSFGWLPTLVRQKTNGQYIPTEQIAHGQRLYALSVTAAKPSFEVSSPDLIRSGCSGQRRHLDPARFARPAPTRSGKSQSLQPSGNGGRCRSLAILPKQRGLDFFCAPMPVPLTRASNPLNPLAPHSQGHSMWSAAAIAQIATPTFSETAQPLVSRFSTDAKDLAPTTHRSFTAEQSFNQLPPLPNNRCVFPRHSRGKTQKLPKKLLPMSCY